MPITLNNYTFSNVVFEIEENTNVSNQHTTGVLTISPLEGYSVTASDFSSDPSFSDPNVTDVVFTQSGDNVLCTVTFDTSFVMPSANVDIDLCIIGQGVAVESSISGFITATVNEELDAGSGNETLTPYSNTGAINSTETLFTRTYTADTGYYFLNQPIVSIINGNQAHYNIVQTPTYDANNNVTSYLVTVNYQYPTSDVSGDFIKIDIPKTLVGIIYLPQPKLTGYVFNTSAISNAEEVRALTVVGEPGTTFSATLNDGTTTTTIISNEDISSNGRYEHDITFPALAKGDPNVTYTITISTAEIDAIEQPNPIIVKQLNDVYIEIDVTNPPTPISGWPAIEPKVTYKALSATPFINDISKSSGAWLIQIDEAITPFSGTGTFTIDKQVELSDFAETVTIEGTINGNQNNTTTLVLDDTTGILAGDKFNTPSFSPNPTNNQLAPFTYEVVSVDSGTNLTITPAGSFLDNNTILFTRSNGNIIEVIESDVTLTNSSTVNLKFNIAVRNYGDANETFNLDLSNIISYTP
jgi:hypothetical protein